MGSYATVVIRHDEDPQPAEEVLRFLEGHGLVQCVRFRSESNAGLLIGVDLKDRVFGEVPETEQHLLGLAKSFGLHVALILAVSSTDSFRYIHWLSDCVVRELGCGVDEQFQWTRVQGEPEEWEAEAFDAEEVIGTDGRKRTLGRAADGHIQSPRLGDDSTPVAMKYAECALRYQTGEASRSAGAPIACSTGSVSIRSAAKDRPGEVSDNGRAGRFPESADTRVWFTPDAVLIEWRCIVEKVGPPYEMRTLPLDVDDVTLGAEIADALANVRPRTWEEIDPLLSAFAMAYPDYDQFSGRYHSVGVVFRAQQAPDSIKLDGRAAKINKPNRILIPVGSSGAELGAAVRAMLTKLGPPREPQTNQATRMPESR
jgi:hypothetical protein